ncbi:MAG TPA: SDR family oxidoreductase [Alphaproteobacteria bacterium]
MALFTVLGATGFIGTHVARRLRRDGHDVRAPARDEPIGPRPLGHALYCIGLTADYARRPYDTVDAHVGVLNRILREGQFESLVYLSSTRLYDSAGGAGREDADLALNPNNPRHLYDLSKALGESLCIANGRARIARLACVYSDAMETGDFLPQLVRRALRERHIALDAPANGERDYIHVDDVCAVVIDIALRGRRPIYNVASGVNVANSALCTLVGALTGALITPAATKPGLAFARIDISAIAADFAAAPAPLDGNLRRIVPALRLARQAAVA